MSSSNASAGLMKAPVSSYMYKQMIPVAPVSDEAESVKEPQVLITERELTARLAEQRTAGFAEAEAKLLQRFQEKTDQLTTKTAGAIAEFETHQKGYFARVEAEVVKLALSIAGKILHREAQVDPMLVAALVHIAIAQLKEGSSASLRVRPEQVQRWRGHLETLETEITLKVSGDKDLEDGDCILETELGTVNFSLDAQLKEVERGFFDVLAQKPQI